MKYALNQIIEATPIRVETEYWDIHGAMEAIGQELQYSDVYNCNDSCSSVKSNVMVDVNYDGRRGARTEVLLYENKVFAVTSRAGRELDDREDIYIIDKGLTMKALQEFFVPSIEDSEESPLDTEIELAYWEGCPVKLCDKFYGIK